MWLGTLPIVGPTHVDPEDTFKIFRCTDNPGFQGEPLLVIQFSLVFPCPVSFLFWQFGGIDVFEGLKVTGKNLNTTSLVGTLKYPAY